MDKKEREENFIKMIHRNEKIIYKVCSFYSNTEIPIADLYQDVVINLWGSEDRFRGECSESTWIYRIALNTCISHVRKDIRKPPKVSLSLLSDIIAEPETLDVHLKELYALIHRLKTMEKAIVLLWLEEKSYQEIADITGLTLSNVATKLKRAKIKLKEMSNQ